MIIRGDIHSLANETIPHLLKEKYNLPDLPRFAAESYNTLTYRMNEWVFNVKCEYLEDIQYDITL